MGQIAEGQCGGAAADGERSTCAFAQGDQSTMQADAAWPIREQHQRLCRVLKGHYAYFGITGNFKRLVLLHHQVQRLWQKVVVASVLEELCAMGTVLFECWNASRCRRPGSTRACLRHPEWAKLSDEEPHA